MRKAAFVLACASLLASCTSRAPHTSASSSSTPSAVPTVVASATRKPVHVVSARQMLYVYKSAIWLYDAKSNHARQVTQGGTVALPRWIDADHFSFVAGGNTLRIVDLGASTVTDVFTAPGGIQAYGWSPDAQTVAYIETDSEAYPHLRFRSIADGATRSVATLARAPGRGVTPSDDVRIQFSKDGAYVLVVYTPADGDTTAVPPEQSQFQVRGADGSLAFSVGMSRDPTMGLFARDGKTVYFMDTGGVRAWTAATGSTRTIRTMHWFDPWQSPDGTFVAFDTGSFSARARIQMLDLKASTVRTVSKPGRVLPIVAGPSTIWAEQISGCAGGCDGPTLGTVVAIDMRTMQERALPVQSLQDADVLYG